MFFTEHIWTSTFATIVKLQLIQHKFLIFLWSFWKKYFVVTVLATLFSQTYSRTLKILQHFIKFVSTWCGLHDFLVLVATWIVEPNANCWCNKRKVTTFPSFLQLYPASIYLFKDNTRKVFEICLNSVLLLSLLTLRP